ncbi:MAG: DUF4142 domain-containing protein [Chitinophagaceae bacterium]|nr:DUF4142 domain-containing protein [Chitinophagaceae bacterium]
MKKKNIFVALAAGFLVGSLLGAAPVYSQNAQKLTDPQIASVAVTANQIDVDYAAIALKKSKNAEVLNFAKTMTNDHNAVIKQAVALANKLNVTPETNAVTRQLLSDAKAEEKKLKGLKGAAFDKAYVDNEVAYHTSVIGAVETVLIPDADNAELKSLLQTAVPAFKTHLEHAKMLQKSLNK